MTDHQAIVLEAVIDRLLALNAGPPFVVSVDSASTFELGAIKGIPRCELVEVGVREGSAVALALGASSAGVPAVVAAFAAFGLRRGFESLAVHAATAMPSPMVLLGGLPGLLAARDGISHHALDDLALVRALPGVRAWIPCCATAAAAAVDDAIRRGGVVYLRVYRGHAPVERCDCEGRGFVVRQTSEGRCAVIGYGPILWETRRQAPGSLTVIEVSDVHDPSEGFVRELRRHEHVVVVDEHRGVGGLAAELTTAMPARRLTALVADHDPGSGSYDDLLMACSIDPQSVIQTAMRKDHHG